MNDPGSPSPAKQQFRSAQYLAICSEFQTLLFLRAPALLSQSYTRAPAIFVDELDAGGFKGSLNYIQRGSAGLTCSVFQLMDSNRANPGIFGQILLAPANKSASCSALGGGKHEMRMLLQCKSYNSIDFLLTGISI